MFLHYTRIHVHNQSWTLSCRMGHTTMNLCSHIFIFGNAVRFQIWSALSRGVLPAIQVTVKLQLTVFLYVMPYNMVDWCLSIKRQRHIPKDRQPSDTSPWEHELSNMATLGWGMLEIFPIQALSFIEYGPMLRGGFELTIPGLKWSSTLQLCIASCDYSVKGHLVTSGFRVKTLLILN
jgi:hypothetical protein